MRKKELPVVYIDPRAYGLMSLWSKLAGKKNQEFTCLGRAQLLESGHVFIGDAWLVVHEGNSGSVEADDDSVNELIFDLDEKGIPCDELRCWVHSHPGTGPSATYLSSTDESNITRFMTGEWLVSIVFDSIGGSPYCRIDVKNPRMRIEAELEICYELSAEDDKLAREEFEEKAKKMVYKVPAGKSKVTSLVKPLFDVQHGGVYLGGASSLYIDDDDADWNALDGYAHYEGGEMSVREIEAIIRKNRHYIDGIGDQVVSLETSVEWGVRAIAALGIPMESAEEELDDMTGGSGFSIYEGADVDYDAAWALKMEEEEGKLQEENSIAVAEAIEDERLISEWEDEWEGEPEANGRGILSRRVIERWNEAGDALMHFNMQNGTPCPVISDEGETVEFELEEGS